MVKTFGFAYIASLVIIGLLSIAAGAAKIALVPEEADFLRAFGFTNTLTISFGIVQALSGLLLVIPVTRFYGSLIAATVTPDMPVLGNVCRRARAELYAFNMNT